jgi:gliding motility-associated-like protein
MLSIFYLNAEAGNPRMKRICIAGNGNITLNWFDFKDTCEKFDKVLIFGRPDDFSGFRLIDSVKFKSSNSYLYLNGSNYLNGAFFIEYIIECSGRQIIISDTMRVDVNPPPKTDPDSISVNSDGSVVIGWSTKPDSLYKDTKSFIVYSVTTGNFPVDTVLRNDGSEGRDKKSNANSGPVSYLLAPTDSCDNVAPLGNAHTTNFISASQDSCKYEVTLSWTGYKGWSTGVKGYEIFYSLDSSKGYTYAGLVNSTQYIFSGLVNLSKYFFYVRAVKNDTRRITSSSNRIALVTQFEKVFNYVYIKTVSVDANTLRIDWTTNENTSVGYFELYKGKNTGSMRLIANISGSALQNGQFRYIDTDVDPSSEVWLYKIKAFNSCGHFAGFSNISHNIVLKLNKYGRTKVLTWNAFEDWSGKVMLYSIQRTVADGSQQVEAIGQESRYDLSFSDNDSFSAYIQPGVCYRVKALEGDSDKYGFIEESYSNEVCYIDPPIVYVPNAFVPDEGVNFRFRPVVSFADTVNSVLTIYNRWGEVVFESNDIVKGWDGKTKDGNFAPSQVYLYNIKVTGLDKSVHMYRGTFTLL